MSPETLPKHSKILIHFQARQVHQDRSFSKTAQTFQISYIYNSETHSKRTYGQQIGRFFKSPSITVLGTRYSDVIPSLSSSIVDASNLFILLSVSLTNFAAAASSFRAIDRYVGISSFRRRHLTRVPRR